METAFYQDIMLQKFNVGTFYNPTRFLMLYVMIKDGSFKRKYPLCDLVSLLFNAYCDNPHISLHHPNVQIRKVPFFGKDTIKNDLMEAISDWYKYAKSDTIQWDGYNVLFNLDDSQGVIARQTERILNVLFKKHFNATYLGITKLNLSLLQNDTDLNIFGISKFRERVFADMQYCPICDDCNIENLYAVHVLPAALCSIEEQLEDVNNGILMCKKHAEMYLNKEFYFDHRGKVVSKDIELNGTHLPIALYKTRKRYIDLLLEQINK